METNVTLEQIAQKLESLQEQINAVQEKLDKMTRGYSKPIFYTEHPHIVRVHGAQGGEPIVRGKGVTVKTIAALFKQGIAPEKLVEDYGGHLNLAQIYDALSYYYDHPGEIEQYEAEDRAVEAQFFAPDHPYVNALAPDREPTLRNTRISVREVAERAQAMDSMQALLAEYPSLTPALIFDALSYYFDHPERFSEGQAAREESMWQPTVPVST